MITHLINVATALLRDRRKRATRSPQWSVVERVFKKDHSTCAACGSRTLIQVHHKIPFHLRSDLELDRGNLISLCMSLGRACHLAIGHGGSWAAYNPNIERDAADALERPLFFADITSRARSARLL